MPQTQTKPPPKPSLHLNWQDWAHDLKAWDAPDEAKRALIESVWGIAMGFVDLGWGITSEPETSGQDIDLAAVLRAAVVCSEEELSPVSEQEPDGQTTTSKEEV